MKSKRKDITIKELFRNKLEFVEVAPNPDLKSQLMKKVARKEFMHFNPGSLNIFYLGGIIGALIFAFVLFISGHKNKVVISGEEGHLIKSDSLNTFPASVTKDVYKQVPAAYEQTSGNKSATVTFSEAVKDEPEELTKKNPVIPAFERVDFTKNDFLGKHDTGQNQLKPASSSRSIIEPLSSSGCAPFKVRFSSITNVDDSCIWTFGDGGFSNDHNPEWIYDVEGEYRVGLLVINKDGRNISSSATITVYPASKAQFEISPENALIPKDEISFLNYSCNAEKFKWNFGDGAESEIFEPHHLYKIPGNYNVSLTVFSSHGCSDSLTISNAFSGSEYFIDFPNAFIPNQLGPAGGYYSSRTDESAQIFHPSGSGISEYQLKIFSKLGILIFESRDFNSGWDGYNKGQICEPGVYIWKVRGKFRNGEPFIKMGDVTLLKF